jgi:transcriptional regulator with XRE-family HTH domain
MTPTFGSRVRQLRRQETMSQQDLATRTYITVSYLDKIERGQCPYSALTSTALACALGVDWDELVALGDQVPFDIIHILVRSPLLVQLVRLGSQGSDDQVLLFLRQNRVSETKLHYITPGGGSNITPGAAQAETADQVG